MKMYPVNHLAAATLVANFLIQSASAAVIGTDSFDYPDGTINGQTGGAGWNVSGGTADWSGSGSVVSGTFVIGGGNNGFREYGGDEGASAIPGTGQAFFRIQVTTGVDQPDYFGLSSFDFGNERVFFGRTYQNNFGIDVSGSGAFPTGTLPAPNTTYTITGVIDFTNDKVAFFLDPDGSDFYNASNGTNSADVETAYTSNNFSSRIRLQGGDGPPGSTVAWDNLTVGTEAGDVLLAVPEPSSALLLAGSLGVLMRRRRA